MPGGNSRHSVLYPPYPVYALSGQGCRLTDADGQTRIDCVNNMSALIHGHGNPAVLKALHEQSTKLLCVGAPTEIEIELAEIICDRLESVDQLRFTNSGSEAIMFACRAARAYTGKSKIAKVEGAYHGSYDSVEFGLSPNPTNWGSAQSPAVVPATLGIAEGVQADTLVIPFNDIEGTRSVLEAHADQLAAVLIDPLISRMGFVPASAEYLEFIRQFTQANNSLLVFDEVFSFRMGYNGAQGVVNISPDLTVLGKVIGGGLPIGAIGGSQECMEVFNHGEGEPSVEHSGTFFANPMSMAAGKAALEQLTPGVMDRLNTLGDEFRAGLKDALNETGVSGYVAGAASLTAVILAEKPPINYRETFACMAGGALQKGMLLHRFLLDAGVQIIPPGGMILSTPMQRDDLDEILSAIKAGLKYVKSKVS